MKTVKITVTYQGPIDAKLDESLRKDMESIGAKWIGQGTTLATGIRDIGFKIER